MSGKQWRVFLLTRENVLSVLNFAVKSMIRNRTITSYFDTNGAQFSWIRMDLTDLVQISWVSCLPLLLSSSHPLLLLFEVSSPFSRPVQCRSYLRVNFLQFHRAWATEEYLLRVLSLSLERVPSFPVRIMSWLWIMGHLVFIQRVPWSASEKSLDYSSNNVSKLYNIAARGYLVYR